MNCKIIIENSFKEFKITVSGKDIVVCKGINELFFTAPLDEEFEIFSVSCLPPGIQKEILIKKIYFDHYLYKNFQNFLSFEMIDNPYVENKVLKKFVNEINFNGILKINISSKELFYFPYYHSTKKNNYVFSNNLLTCTGDHGCWVGEGDIHTKGFLNSPYDKHIRPNDRGKIAAFGCSYTYGTANLKKQAWPEILSETLEEAVLNFGVPGIGIDGIYQNIYNVINDFDPKKIIVLFPNLERRLAKLEKNGLFFDIPILANSMDYFDCFYLSKEEIEKITKDTIRDIVNDKNNLYSLSFLEKINKLSKKIYVSSWDRDTYEVLPNFFKKVLPKFDQIDFALDKRHAGVLSNKTWVESIKDLI
jgi:hypothetical protein